MPRSSAAVRSGSVTALRAKPRDVRAQEVAEVELRKRRRTLAVDDAHHLHRRHAVGDHRGHERSGARPDVHVEVVDGAVDGQQVERAQGADLVDAAGEPAAAEHERGLGALAPRPRLGRGALRGLELDDVAHRRILRTSAPETGRAGASPDRACCCVPEMRRVIATLLALAAVLAGAAPAAAISESGLRSIISREMRKAPAASGAYVRDMNTGAELYALRENAVRIPASVEKLFTTSAALLRLGASATLTTRVVVAPDAVIEPDGTLRGDLVLVGGGDPFFGDAAAAQLAKSVRAAGIRRIAGAVVGDETAFDSRRSTCCAGYDPDLGGVLSALAYDRGIFRGRARLDAPTFAAGRFAAQLQGRRGDGDGQEPGRRRCRGRQACSRSSSR